MSELRKHTISIKIFSSFFFFFFFSDFFLVYWKLFFPKFSLVFYGFLAFGLFSIGLKDP